MTRRVYYPRWIEDPLKRYLRQFPCVALTGPRQSGKSTTLQHLFGARYRYISFDSSAVRERALQDPELFLDDAGERVILDEIQYVPSILSSLKIRIDRRREVPGRYLLTGSQQFELMKGLTETLAGRVGLLTLLPFASLEAVEATGRKHSAQHHFLQWALRGGFPELIAHPRAAARAWYDSYINTYLERDVRGLYGVGHLREFRRFLALLASSCGQLFNMSHYANAIGVSVPTIRQWASILESSWIVLFLEPYYRNFGKRLVKSPKVYFWDGGLVSYLIGLETPSHILQGPFAGALFENYVIAETAKQFRHRGRRPRIYFWRTNAGAEVDLLIERAGRLHPVECKLNKTIRSAMADGLRQFLALAPAPQAAPGTLVSLTEESGHLDRRIRSLNVLDYLAEWS